MELNPIVISIISLCTLCMLRINVLFALMISSIIAGLIVKMPIKQIMDLFISGMGQNSETALSYILLGTFAAAMTHNGFTQVFANAISKYTDKNKYILIGIIVIVSILSQNLIPVHIAFIPILIPPLLKIMNRLKLDRRVIACSIAFGLKAPYIAIPAGFGLIFQGLVADNLTQNGITVLKSEVWHYSIYLGVAMFFALLFAIFISYRKPREYKDDFKCEENIENIKFNKKHFITFIGAITTLIVQLISGSLPFGALVGLCIIFGFRAVNHDKMDRLLDEGVRLMGYIAFVMLVCGGYALVLKESGGIESLITSLTPYMTISMFFAVTIMLLIGLLITIGIGSSFGTIPILAVLYVPICQSIGLSVPSIIVIICAAAALGDAGSPASDTTLGPTAGLNVDNQHNHIKDTCIPTFLHYNIALIIATYIAVFIFK